MTKDSKKLNKKTDGLGNNSKREEALYRIGKAEEAIGQLQGAIAQLVPALQNSFKRAQDDASETAKNIENLDRVVASLVNVLGGKLPDTTKEGLLELVTEDVKGNRIAQLEAQAEASAANVKVALAEGKLVVANTVENDDTIVVTSQVTETGEALHPTKAYRQLKQFSPGLQELLKGKEAGATITLPTEGGTLTVLEIYNQVHQAEVVEPADKANNG